MGALFSACVQSKGGETGGPSSETSETYKVVSGSFYLNHRFIVFSYARKTEV